MLIGMAMNHIASPLHLFTDHPLGYTSAAEGFVFLSGLVAGLVYTRRRYRLGPMAMARATRVRVCTIYACHLALLLALVLWTKLFVTFTGSLAGNTPPLMWDHPIASLIAGMLLINQPPLLDILPLYTGLMLLLPMLLTSLSRGHYGRVLVVSGGIWLATNLVYPSTPYVSGIVQIGAFNFGAWQLVFVLGAMFGQAWAMKRELLSRSAAPFFITVSVALCTYCFLIRHWYIPAPFPGFADWVNKNNMAPARLFNTLALFYLAHLAFVRWPRAFMWPPLALLGRHSLVIFSVHVAVAYVLYAFPQYVAMNVAQTWLGTGIMLAVMFAVANVVEIIERPQSATSRAKAVSRV